VFEQKELVHLTEFDRLSGAEACNKELRNSISMTEGEQQQVDSVLAVLFQRRKFSARGFARYRRHRERMEGFLSADMLARQDLYGSVHATCAAQKQRDDAEAAMERVCQQLQLAKLAAEQQQQPAKEAAGQQQQLAKETAEQPQQLAKEGVEQPQQLAKERAEQPKQLAKESAEQLQQFAKEAAEQQQPTQEQQVQDVGQEARLNEAVRCGAASALIHIVPKSRKVSWDLKLRGRGVAPGVELRLWAPT
jgi:hypothetical protein